MWRESKNPPINIHIFGQGDNCARAVQGMVLLASRSLLLSLLLGHANGHFMWTTLATSGAVQPPRVTPPLARQPSGGSVALAASAAVGNLLQGYNTGIVAAALLSIVPEFGLQQQPGMVGLIASSTTLGAVTGTIASGPLCDRAGRRGTLMLSSVLFLLGGALMGWSPRVDVLIVGRLVGGVATGLVSTAVPQYLAECALPAWRGALIRVRDRVRVQIRVRRAAAAGQGWGQVM